MYRKAALALFLVLTGLSIFFAFHEERTATTTSAEAYKHYKAGLDNYDKFYFRQAVKELEQAVTLDTNFALAYAELARSYGSLGFTQKNKETWQRAFAKRPFVSEREQLLLDIWQAQFNGNTDDMNKLAQEYIEKYPKHIEGYSNMALIEFNKEDWEQTVDLYQKCLKIDPNYPLAFNMLGYLNYYLGRYDDALSYLTKYIQLCPNQANPHDSKGEILHALGRYDEAISEFREAFNINPEFDFAVIHMADSYLSLGQLAQADYCYQTLTSQANNDLKRNQVLIMKARVLFFRDNVDSALSLLNYVAATDTSLRSGAIDACFMKGYICYTKRDLPRLTSTWQQAEGLLKRATEMHPALIDSERLARLNLYINATMADLKGDLDLSAKLFSEYVDSTRQPSEKITVRCLYADVLRRMGQTDVAKSELQKSLSINPNHARSLVLYADACEAEGDTSTAFDYRKKAMAIWKDADPDFEQFVELQKKLDTSLARNPKQQISQP